MNSTVVFIIPPAAPLPRVLIPMVQSLLPANPTYPAITFREGQQLIIVGVVTATIKRFRQ